MASLENRSHDAADRGTLSEHRSANDGTFTKSRTNNRQDWVFSSTPIDDAAILRPHLDPCFPIVELDISPKSTTATTTAVATATTTTTATTPATPILSTTTSTHQTQPSHIRTRSGPEPCMEDLDSPSSPLWEASPLTPSLVPPSWATTPPPTSWDDCLDDLLHSPSPLDSPLEVPPAEEDALALLDDLKSPPVPALAPQRDGAPFLTSGGEAHTGETSHQHRHWEAQQAAQGRQRQVSTLTRAHSRRRLAPDMLRANGRATTTAELQEMFRADHRPLLKEFLDMIRVSPQRYGITPFRRRRGNFRNSALSVDRETFRKMYKFLMHHGEEKTAHLLKRERRRAQNRETERVRFWKARRGIHGLVKENSRLRDQLRATNAAIARLTQLREQKRPPCSLPDEPIVSSGDGQT